MSEKLVLIDGHSILNRAFYGVPDLSNAKGLHTNAVYGFLNIMFKILDEECADYFAVAFDVKAPTFRHEMFDQYKGTRKSMPDELREQVPVLKELLHAMNITIVELPGYEADDILGTLARRGEQEGMDVSVVSGDRDLLQLATKKVKIRIPKTRRGVTEVEDYTEKDVLEKYQVTPLELIDVKALMGDSSDNIPGIPGVGEKTAVKIIGEYKNIENAYTHVEDIKPNKAKESLRDHYDLAQMSKKLAMINTDSPVDQNIREAALGNVFTQEAYPLFQQLEFKNYLSKFSKEDTKSTSIPAINKVSMLDEAQSALLKVCEIGDAGIFFASEAEQLEGVALYGGKEALYYIEIGGLITEDWLLSELKGIVNRLKVISAMDYKQVLSYLAVPREKAFDTSIAAYLLNPLKNGYSYDDIAREYLDEMFPSRQELLEKRSLTLASSEKEQEFLAFAGYMAYTARESRPALEKKLKDWDMLKLFLEIEMPLVFALHEMEQVGIIADGDALKEYGSRLGEQIKILEKKIYEQAGEEFNINSPKQLGVILFDKLKMPFGKKTKTGYSTAADVLERLAPDHPIVSDILEYRQLTKLKSTYADGLVTFIQEDGRIHSNFNQTITATGRISSTEPNLQNIPVRMELGRLIRKVFIPREGCVFIDADYSQIELRVLAHFSGDKALIQAYREAQDIHRITASQVFHTPFDQVTPLQRRNAKAVNFGIVYGISSFGLSQDLSISRKEATEYIERYFETYPGIKAFLDGTVKQAKKEGYVTTLFHRRRPIPELSSSNFVQRSFGERVAMNSPIQGTAADIIKIAMIHVNQALKDQNLKSRLILQVHDELLIEAWEEEVPQVMQILEYEMRHAADLDVPLEVDMHIGNSWYEAK